MEKCPKCGSEYAEDSCPNCSENPSEGTPEEQQLIHPNRFVRATVKVLMTVLFLGLVTLVVFGSDYVIAWVKTLFTA